MKVPLQKQTPFSSVFALYLVITSPERKELNAPLNRNVQVGNLVQDKPDELLVLLFPKELDEALTLEVLTELDSGQTVLGEAEVEVVGDCYARLVSGAGEKGGKERKRKREKGGEKRTVLTVNGELLSDLGQVTATDETDDSLRANLLEDLEDLRGSGLWERRTR
jgi:hypothetical protein